MDTPILAKLSADARERTAQNCWMRRIGKPDGIARVYAFLAMASSLFVAAAAPLSLALAGANAQTCPDKPVRLVVGYAPGTAPDDRDRQPTASLLQQAWTGTLPML